jgi:hypothetical protein
MSVTVGVPPRFVIALLRLEGLAAGLAGIAGFALSGASWWLFAGLILAPDLALLAMIVSPRRGAIAYDAAHSNVGPIVLIVLGLAVPVAGWLLPVGLIWAAHIGIDRALGYGLKYPDLPGTTHLGPIGPTRKRAQNSDTA